MLDTWNPRIQSDICHNSQNCKGQHGKGCKAKEGGGGGGQQNGLKETKRAIKVYFCRQIRHLTLQTFIYKKRVEIVLK
jgi:hypothetical protein